VSKAYNDLNLLPSDRVKFVSYEHFVANPGKVITEINEWLGFDWQESEIMNSVKDVRTGSVGKGLKSLPPELSEKLEAIVQPVLESVHQKIERDVSDR
jgi:hypothetical protein